MVFQLTSVISLLSLPVLVAADGPVWSTTISRESHIASRQGFVGLQQAAAASSLRSLLAYQNFFANTGKIHPMADARSVGQLIYSREIDMHSNVEGAEKRQLQSIPYHVTIDKSSNGASYRSYTGLVSVGAPPHHLSPVTFDIASSDVLIKSSAFPNSTESRKTKVTFDDPYTQGQRDAIVVDTCTVGTLVIKDQPFGLVPHISDTLKGFVGLAGEELSSFQGQSWIDAAQEQGVLEDRIFGFALSDKDSTFDIGGVPEAYRKKLTWVRSAARVGYVQVDASINKLAVFGFLDNISTTILVPQSQFERACRSAGGRVRKGDGQDSDSCTYDPAKGFHLTVQFGNFTYQVPKENLLYDVDPKTKRAISVLQSSSYNAGWIFGLPILEGLYVSVNKDTEQVGFVSLK